MTYRYVVVLLSYMFSSVGIFFTFRMLLEGLKHPTPSNLIPLIWLLGWGFHAAMCVGWVTNKKLPAVIPIVGTTLGLLGLIVMPAQMAIEVDEAIRLVGTEILFVLPCFVLAIVLVRFHLTQDHRASDD